MHHIRRTITVSAIAILTSLFAAPPASAQVKKGEAQKGEAKKVAQKKKKTAKKVVAIDINKASAKDLEKGLKGIGKVKAEAIVAYRKKNGPFRTTDDLLKVAGVGPATVAANLSALKLARGKVDLTKIGKGKTVEASSEKKKGAKKTPPKKKAKKTSKKKEPAKKSSGKKSA